MAVNELGTVIPGSTIYLPFHTFSSDDPSASMTITGLAVTDVEIYKDGGVTQRSSDAGITLLDTDGIDFDGITGIHGVSVNLADNTDAGFYEAGSQYTVVISSITLDGATVNFVLARFRIGYPGAMLDTTIASLSSQTSFTLEEGSANDNAYNGCVVCVHDVASAVQVAFGIVNDYTGATKTVTLAADPGIFTMAAGDNISFFPPSNVHAWNAVPLATTNPLPNAAADAAGGLPVSDAGGLDLDTILGRITANVALASVCTEARLAELAAANLPADIDQIKGDTTTDIPALIATAQADLDIITGPAGVVIADGLLTAAKFGADFLTAAKIADDAFVAANFATGCLTADAFAADALVAATFATDCLTNDALAASFVTEIWARVGAITSVAMETVVERIYEMINNKMTVNESTGAVALRNIGDTADVATGSVTSSAGTTTRGELSWV